MKSTAALILGCLLAVLVAACGPKSNLVPLEYIPLQHAQGLCAHPVAVGPFLDMRPEKNLGRDETHVLYPAGGSVEAWVADAFVQELAARGCEVAASDPASPFNPEQALAGEVTRLAVVRDGFKYTVDMELAVKLLRGTDMVFHKVYAGRWEDTFVTPSETRFRDLLRAALQETVGRALADLRLQLGGV